MVFRRLFFNTMVTAHTLRNFFKFSGLLQYLSFCELKLCQITSCFKICFYSIIRESLFMKTCKNMPRSVIQKTLIMTVYMTMAFKSTANFTFAKHFKFFCTIAESVFL